MLTNVKNSDTKMHADLQYLKEISIIEDKKAGMVWNLVTVEEDLEDSQYESACRTMLEIANDLETVVDLVKTKSEITTIPDVVKELKIIKDFAESSSTIIRGRSWEAICGAFDPTKSLDTVKALKSILRRPDKKARARPAPVTPPVDVSVEIQKDAESRLISLREIANRSDARQFAQNQILDKHPELREKGLGSDNHDQVSRSRTGSRTPHQRFPVYNHSCSIAGRTHECPCVLHS